MINYNFITVIIILYAQEAYTQLPSYVHLHTTEEIMETNYVILDKLDVCKASRNVSTRLLIAIKTAIIHYDQRDIIRQTWLAEVVEYHIPYVFVLGSTTDEKVLDTLLTEDKLYNDLLIGKPVDTYYNLTLKGLFLLTWAKTYCPTNWVLYADDDAIVNVQAVVDFVASVKNVSDRVIYCCAIRKASADRNPQSQWFVPISIWKFAHYPDWCRGLGYLIPPNVLPILQEAVINNITEPKLWLEDVFITGIAAKAAGIKLIKSPMQGDECDNRRSANESLVLGGMGRGSAFLDKWKKLRGKSIPRIRIQFKHIPSMNKMTRFYKNGHRLTTNMQTGIKLFKFMREAQYSNLMNYLLYLIIITVIGIVIVLYKLRLWYILRSFFEKMMGHSIKKQIGLSLEETTNTV